MARIEWIEHRLLNWARWKMAAGSGALGFAAVSMSEANADRDGYIEAAIPISDVEAGETDAAVRRLNPPGLHLTVVEVYTGRGGIKDKAKRLCCAEATVHARIDQAHRQIAAQLNERRRRADDERARVQALQRSFPH